MNNKKRIGIVVAVGLLCLVLLLRRHRVGTTVTLGATAAGQQLAQSALRGVRRPAKPTQVTEGPPAGPVIETISVENRETCNGGDNLVTVRLASAYANDPNIRILMPGQGGTGPQMPFRLSLWDGKQPDMPEVVVYSRSGVLATTKIPTVTVKDCPPEPSLAVAVALVANTSATYTLTATVRNPGPTPFQPVEWQWDFGDGADDMTHVRTVEHSYEDRPQKTRVSEFLVHVRAVDAQGMEIVGRAGLELRNPAFEALSIKHAIVLSTELSPRFPTLGADGRVMERARIHHAYDKPVTIEKVILQRFRRTPDDREEVQETEIDPRQILATNVIPPGSGIDATATLDTTTDKEISFLTYELHGTSVDGLRAWGQFSVMRPPEVIPKEQRQLITDGRLKAEILATQTILKRDRVSLDDINKLEREGAFDNLTITEDGANAGGDQPVSPPPKPRRGMMGTTHPPGR